MKSRSAKLFSIILSILMILQTVPAAAWSGEAGNSAGFMNVSESKRG